MTKPASTSKTTCKQYTPELRDEALKLAERTGVAAAARELSLYESQLYNWRSKQQQQMTSSERENELAAENTRLKRHLAELLRCSCSPAIPFLWLPGNMALHSICFLNGNDL